MNKVVATTQFACSWELERNLDTAASLVREAAARGANLVLLQELFATALLHNSKAGQQSLRRRFRSVDLLSYRHT